MNAFTAAKRATTIVLLGALLGAAPALAGDSGYLGVMLQDLSPAMAKALQLGEQSGVLVSDVVDDGPAEKAGLQDGDVIIAFAGKKLDDQSDLGKAVRAAKPGDTVDVTVLRDGKQQTIKVELGERETGNQFVWSTGDGDDDDVQVIMKRLHGGSGDFAFQAMHEDHGWLGVQIDDLSPQLGEHFGVKDGNGVLVTGVDAESPAAKAGLKAGDVIVGAGKDEVEGTDDLQEALAGTKAEEKFDLEYVRGGKKQKVQLTLGEMPEGSAPNVFYFNDQMHSMPPKMMHRYMAPHAMGGPQRIEIISDMDDANEDLQEMREELDQMRKDLQEMQKELQKK